MKKSRKALLFLLILIISLSLIASFLMLQNSFFKCAHKNITVSTILPTCKAEGKTIHSCNDCTYYYTTNQTPATEHQYAPFTLPATCSSEGYVFYACSCGSFYKSEALPMTEHSFVSKNVSATCISEGYTEHLCSNCGYAYKDNPTATSAHDYISTVYFPTALGTGYTEYACSCSASYKDEFISYSEILSSPYLESSEVISRGIDVSRWNHQIDPVSGEYLPLDWQKIKAAGFDFVIIKAGSTRSGKEPTFEMDYAGARQAGLDIGAYFYTYSSTVDRIKNDVSKLLEYIFEKSFEYPIYFDLEDPSLAGLGKNELTELCEVFICSMQKSGYYSALYTNNNWLQNILNTSRILSLFDIWYARYPQTDIPVWNEEKYGKQLSMWQYTQNGEIDGIDGYFDFNLCYRNYPKIMRKWGLNGVSTY